MVEKCRAFAPGNISCVFKIVHNPDPTRMHSLGMGFTVREGVVATVSLDGGSTEVEFNGEAVAFPTVSAVVEKLTPQAVRVQLESPLPLSCGFGLSGASALATAYAVNSLLQVERDEEQLAMIAHVAEVENLTGLGDVCAQYHGGCLVKLREGHPLAAESLPVGEQPIYYRYFSPIQTREVLRDSRRKEQINRAADRALADIKNDLKAGEIDFVSCIKISKLFALESRLLKDQRVQQIIRQVEDAGGVASMIMLGNAVFSNRPFTAAQETRLLQHSVRLI